jgi:DNA/RNA-binding domain of Phe-tRNA-synthetase-like protein
MRKITYRIDPEIFTRFPGYCRGVVVLDGLHNGPSPAELLADLRQAEEDLRRSLVVEDIPLNPRLQSWRQAFTAFGAKPNKYRPSIEALVRRALKEQIPSINALVDAGNLLSLRHLVPVGAHSLDVVQGDLVLGFARGSEVFHGFDADEVEHPEPGEVVYLEGELVLTRRWTWRQAQHTLILPETRSIEFNVDVLPPVDETEAQDICQQVLELVTRCCGGQGWHTVLSQGQPQVEITTA